MSKYTTELRFIAETEAGFQESQPFSKMDEVMQLARPKIFNFDYPIFDEDYRPTLEYKIMRRYWTQEICEETYGLWKLRLQTKLNEIMPYYNKLYETEAQEYNPLWDVDYYEKRDGTSHAEGSGEDHNTVQLGGADTHNKTGSDSREGTTTDKRTDTRKADDWDLYNDTPQGGLNGIKSQTYLTTATNRTADDKDTSEGSGTSKDKTTYGSQDKTSYGRTETGDRTNSSENLTTDDYLTHIYGYRGRPAVELIRAYRDALINIDTMILDDLEILFMGLW